MSESAVKTGQCLCGAVTYELRNAGSGAVACHCGQCRRQSGHYTVSVSGAQSDLTVTEDRGLTWYQSSDEARRGFCRECGSLLFWQRTHGDDITVYLGSLDLPTGATLANHIFVEDKSDYYEINDGLPQFEGYDQPIKIDKRTP
jgi:hypothetical protein